MSLFKTPTPNYKQQSANGGIQHPRGLYGWLASLLSTSTPVYKTRASAARTDKPPAEK